MRSESAPNPEPQLLLTNFMSSVINRGSPEHDKHLKHIELEKTSAEKVKEPVAEVKKEEPKTETKVTK